ncbi:hypothetical protein V6N13_137966 [Hibiscus sabdariffa]|uniref:Cytochrome c oxidase subunit 5C n=1 Tax=Hibiscus sabdariffa TaxID=183260 RepID=A0ABR2QCJ6_9ROSI
MMDISIDPLRSWPRPLVVPIEFHPWFIDAASIRFSYRSEMAGGRVAHATLKGPSVVKEIVIGITLGLCAGGLWKMHHWNEQRKVRSFYDMLEKGEISVVAEE